MKNLLIKSRKSFSIITGIMFFALIVNSISQRIPINYVEANQSENIGTLSISTSIGIEEELTAKKVIITTVPQYTPDPIKIENIRNYLSGRNAPLAIYAEEFVKAADYYDIDYKIVAAISVIESGGGKSTFKPFNAWGWGKAGFASWEDGIWTVSKGISGYYSRGLTTPKLIAPYYCPPNAENWSNKVLFVMNKISE